MVDIVADKENIADKGEEFYKDFDVVCMNDCPTDAQVILVDHYNFLLFQQKMVPVYLSLLYFL